MTQGFGSSMKTPAIPAGRFIKQQHKSTVNCEEFNAARQIDINKKPISTTTPVNTINSRQLQFKQQYNFRNDQPARKRKALFIGINYFGTSNALRGCVDDAYRMRAFLEIQFGFRREDTQLMTDELMNRGTSREPTRANLINAFQWLVGDAQPGDQLFVHYSGHGGRKTSYTEASGFDETIYPVDFTRNGPIADVELREMLVDSLPANCDLMAVFDSCHSGTILNLQYLYNVDGTAVPDGYRPIARQFPLPYCGTGLNSVLQSIAGFVRRKRVDNKNLAQAAAGSSVIMSCRDRDRKKTSMPPPDPKRSISAAVTYPDVICFSGCESNQLSLDYCPPGKKCYGVMSQYWMDALAANPQQSYLDLLRNLRRMMVNSYFDQQPVLSSNYQMDMNRPFNLQ